MMTTVVDVGIATVESDMLEVWVVSGKGCSVNREVQNQSLVKAWR